VAFVKRHEISYRMLHVCYKIYMIGRNTVETVGASFRELGSGIYRCPIRALMVLSTSIFFVEPDAPLIFFYSHRSTQEF
jgi:hypothetical protein